jgi:hypothetical protein
LAAHAAELGGRHLEYSEVTEAVLVIVRLGEQVQQQIDAWERVFSKGTVDDLG